MKIEIPVGSGTLLPYASILEALNDQRIIRIINEGDGIFTVAENCDGCFSVILNREQLKGLAQEIAQLADYPA